MRCPIQLLISALIVLSSGACSTKRTVAPQYSAVVTKAGDLTRSIAEARSGGKEVKRLQLESLSILDQLDAKLVKLLEK